MAAHEYLNHTNTVVVGEMFQSPTETAYLLKIKQNKKVLSSVLNRVHSSDRRLESHEAVSR